MLGFIWIYILLIIILIKRIIITTLVQVDNIYGERPIFNMVHMARTIMYKHVTCNFWHVGLFAKVINSHLIWPLSIMTI